MSGKGKKHTKHALDLDLENQTFKSRPFSSTRRKSEGSREENKHKKCAFGRRRLGFQVTASCWRSNQRNLYLFICNKCQRLYPNSQISIQILFVHIFFLGYNLCLLFFNLWYTLSSCGTLEQWWIHIEQLHWYSQPLTLQSELIYAPISNFFVLTPTKQKALVYKYQGD